MQSTKPADQCILLNLPIGFVSNTSFVILEALLLMDSTSTFSLQFHPHHLVMPIGLETPLIVIQPVDSSFTSVIISSLGAPRSNPQLHDQALKQSIRQSPMQLLSYSRSLLFSVNFGLSYLPRHCGVITLGLHISQPIQSFTPISSTLKWIFILCVNRWPYDNSVFVSSLVKIKLLIF